MQTYFQKAKKSLLFQSFTACIAASCLLLCACTQDTRAPVQNKGKTSYRYGGSPADNDFDSYSTPTSDRSNSDDAQPTFKSGYRRQAKSAAVPEVGVSDLSTSNSYGANHIEVENENSPFSTTPSKPLEKKTETSELTTPEAVTSRKAVMQGGISLIQPVNGGNIISHFKGEANDGINIAASEGEPIVASASGTVVYTGTEVKNYGNMVVLRHDNGWLTAYGNTSKIVAKKNDYVKQGDIIAFVGSTGGVKSPQLHFALRNGKIPVDPEKYLPVQ